MLARVARASIGDELPNARTCHAADARPVGAKVGDFKIFKRVAALILGVRTALAIAGGRGMGFSWACEMAGSDGMGGFGVQGERGECRRVGCREFG